MIGFYSTNGSGAMWGPVLPVLPVLLVLLQALPAAWRGLAGGWWHEGQPRAFGGGGWYSRGDTLDTWGGVGVGVTEL